jgi:hypothetical protein
MYNNKLSSSNYNYLHIKLNNRIPNMLIYIHQIFYYNDKLIYV